MDIPLFSTATCVIFILYLVFLPHYLEATKCWFYVLCVGAPSAADELTVRTAVLATTRVSKIFDIYVVCRT